MWYRRASDDRIKKFLWLLKHCSRNQTRHQYFPHDAFFLDVFRCPADCTVTIKLFNSMLSTTLANCSSDSTLPSFAPPSGRQGGGAVLATGGATPLGCYVAPVPVSPAAGATGARCSSALPPSVPALSLPGGWCPERRMTNASASSYWRIWTTWLQPHTVPAASTRCWLNGRGGLAVDWPICVCSGGNMAGWCVCVFNRIVCFCVSSPNPDCLHPSCHGFLAESGTQTASLTHGQLNCLLNCPGLWLS